MRSDNLNRLDSVLAACSALDSRMDSFVERKADAEPERARILRYDIQKLKNSLSEAEEHGTSTTELRSRIKQKMAEYERIAAGRSDASNDLLSKFQDARDAFWASAEKLGVTNPQQTHKFDAKTKGLYDAMNKAFDAWQKAAQ